MCFSNFGCRVRGEYPKGQVPCQHFLTAFFERFPRCPEQRLTYQRLDSIVNPWVRLQHKETERLASNVASWIPSRALPPESLAWEKVLCTAGIRGIRITWAPDSNLASLKSQTCRGHPGQTSRVGGRGESKFSKPPANGRRGTKRNEGSGRLQNEVGVLGCVTGPDETNGLGHAPLERHVRFEGQRHAGQRLRKPRLCRL